MEGKPGRIPLAMDEPKHTLANGGTLAPPTPLRPPLKIRLLSGPVDVGDLQDKIVAAMRTCYDPEIPVNIYELGLIYGVDIQESGDVTVRMTLTSPACPAAGSLPGEVQAKVGGIAASNRQGRIGLGPTLEPGPHVGSRARAARHVLRFSRPKSSFLFVDPGARCV